MPGATKATTTHATNGNGKVKKEESEEDDYGESDDEPIVKKRASNGKAKAKAPAKKKVKKEESGSDAEDDEPIKKKPRAPKMKNLKLESDVEMDSDDQPMKKKAQKKAPGKKVKKEEDASGSDMPKKNGKVKKEALSSPKKNGKSKEEAEEEEVYRWWEAQGGDVDGDGTEKWQTLVHNGVIFPPPYEPLPSTVKMKYNGEPC